MAGMMRRPIPMRAPMGTPTRTGTPERAGPYRPVEIASDKAGRLLVTSDEDCSVIAIGYQGE
jgi:hypothetical protein